MVIWKWKWKKNRTAGGEWSVLFFILESDCEGEVMGLGMPRREYEQSLKYWRRSMCLDFDGNVAANA